MDEKTIDLNDFEKYCDLSPGLCISFSEAIRICMENRGHQPGVRLRIEGGFEGEFILTWQPPEPKVLRSWQFQNVAVEWAAYALAAICIWELTPFCMAKQSAQGTGFDYALREKSSVWSGHADAIAEVSGILHGSVGQINFRVKEKLAQPKVVAKDVIIVVVEFSRPLVKMVKK
ncbi:MAG: hypothetical protein AAB316_06500 [Bacteroidota bacterium]